MVCAVQEVMSVDPVLREHTQEAVTPGSTLITNKRISHNIPQIAQEHIALVPLGPSLFSLLKILDFRWDALYVWDAVLTVDVA